MSTGLSLHVAKRGLKETEKSYIKKLDFLHSMERMVNDGTIAVPTKPVKRLGRLDSEGKAVKVNRYHVTSTYFNKVVRWLVHHIDHVGRLLNVAGRVDPNGGAIMRIKGADSVYMSKTELSQLYKYLEDLLMHVAAKLFNYRKFNKALNQKDNEQDGKGSYLPILISKEILLQSLVWGGSTPKLEGKTLVTQGVMNAKDYPLSSEYYKIRALDLRNLFSNMIVNSSSRLSNVLVIDGTKRTIMEVAPTFASTIFPNSKALLRRTGDLKAYPVDLSQRLTVGQTMFPQGLKVNAASAKPAFIGLVCASSSIGPKLQSGGLEFDAAYRSAVSVYDVQSIKLTLEAIIVAKLAITKQK